MFKWHGSYLSNGDFILTPSGNISPIIVINANRQLVIVNAHDCPPHRKNLHLVRTAAYQLLSDWYLVQSIDYTIQDICERACYAISQFPSHVDTKFQELY